MINIDNITDIKATASEIMGDENNLTAVSGLMNSQSILKYIRDHYLTDDKFDVMLSEIELFIDVNEGEFELSDEIVDGFVTAARYVENSDFALKDELAVLLLAALDILN
jgi:hypothetical protein